ncbi:claudin 8 [Phyllostomus discolor]|uniref:Claudin n=1 Tax=Phyllostomus discolor TaxID=89673 RepID=A0A6J2L0E3_9CHIR|nr:claudin-8 [Phyllostomus discolor]KAF6118019.1 claudin 8 [Phyllostomus discolor]
MARAALQYAGLLLGGVGLVGTVAVTVMPQWKVSAFIGANLVVFESLWEGLWMSCKSQAPFRLQCKVYDSLLALPPDLQAARGLMCAAAVLAALAFAAAVLGMKCTRCVGDDDAAKSPLLLAAGVTFVLAGLVALTPVSWVASGVVRDFYNPTLDDGRKRELGEALYLGWASALALVAAGAVLSCVSYARGESRSYRYSLPPQRATPRSGPSDKKPLSVYSRSQYV